MPLRAEGGTIDRKPSAFPAAKEVWEQAQCLGNEACRRLARANRHAFAFGANEVPDLADATTIIEGYLRRGAVIIGEQKFGVECDSPEMERIYHLAEVHHVPVLMHWQF